MHGFVFFFKIFRKRWLIHTTTEEKFKSFCHPSIIKARCWYPACAIACFIVQISAGDHVSHNLLIWLIILKPLNLQFILKIKISYSKQLVRKLTMTSSWNPNHGLGRLLPPNGQYLIQNYARDLMCDLQCTSTQILHFYNYLNKWELNPAINLLNL